MNKKSGVREDQSVPILVIFDNIDRLPLEVIKSFEIMLIDEIARNRKIRFFTSSKKKFQFNKFYNPERKEKMQNSKRK